MKNLSALMTSVLLAMCNVVGLQAQEPNGNFYIMHEWNISPDNYDAFVEWSKEYKKVAEKTKAKSYEAVYSNGNFSFIFFAGNKQEDIQKFEKENDDWEMAHPELDALYKKYSYSARSVNATYWQSAPDLSYVPDNYKPGDYSHSYIRFGDNYIKMDKVEEAKQIIKEYIAEYRKQKVEFKVSIYWNIMGEGWPMLRIMTQWEDAVEWATSVKALNEKFKDNKTIEELGKRFRAVLRESNSYEGFRRPELSHTVE